MLKQKSLHRKFVDLGRQRSKISHELVALIPQIHKTKTYKTFGCATIYEYAALYGDGMSPGVVEKVLKLKEDLKDCPKLFNAVKTQGVHKIAIVSKLAKPETEKELVEIVENMSKSAVQEYSKMRRGKNVRKNMKIEFDEEMEFMFLKLKNKLKTNSNKETMKRLLLAMNSHFFPGEKAKNAVKKRNPSKPASSRHIPAIIKKTTIQKTNGRCSYPSCNKPISIFHHTNGYAKTKTHDALTGLCKIHHEFAHNGIDQVLSKTDFLYRERRKMAIAGRGSG